MCVHADLLIHFLHLGQLADWQTPIAAVLACADSRVPPELIFDQGLGDLFVVRYDLPFAGLGLSPVQIKRWMHAT
jgi:hypothetical protein